MRDSNVLINLTSKYYSSQILYFLNSFFKPSIFVFTCLVLVHLQVELITTQAMKAGFTGGLVVDYPNSTRAKK